MQGALLKVPAPCLLYKSIVTVAAVESADPGREIIRTTRSVVWRICLFYVGSIFIVVCLVPYNAPGLTEPTQGLSLIHI